MGTLELLINTHYRMEYMKQKRPMRKMHPSTIGMCQRKSVLDMLMVPKPIPDSRLLLIFENGHSLHHRYEKLFKDMGILVKDEMKIEYGEISGHTDAWIRIHSLQNPQGTDYLVELKSAFSKSFKWMAENNRPKKEHLDQIMFYLHLVRKQGIPIDKGIIYVENKDTQDIWEYEVTYDKKHGERLEQRALETIAYANERKLPPIPAKHTPSFYKCATCDYNFYCHADSIKRDDSQRYPIPFRFGSKAYVDTLSIIQAIKNNEPVPNVISGDTNGELATEVEMYNYMSPGPLEVVEQYITAHNI